MSSWELFRGLWWSLPWRLVPATSFIWCHSCAFMWWGSVRGTRSSTLQTRTTKSERSDLSQTSDLSNKACNVNAALNRSLKSQPVLKSFFPSIWWKQASKRRTTGAKQGLYCIINQLCFGFWFFFLDNWLIGQPRQLQRPLRKEKIVLNIQCKVQAGILCISWRHTMSRTKLQNRLCGNTEGQILWGHMITDVIRVVEA